jgi:hypothetical protein
LLGLVLYIGTGKLPEGTVLALLVFAVVGAIAPIIVLPVGVVILIVLSLKGDIAGKFFGWLGGLAGKQANPSPPTSIQSSLDPTVYLPNQSIGSV